MGLVLVQMRFKVHRRLVAEGAVEPHPVVKDFDPFKDGGFGFSPGGEVVVAQTAFEAAPKTFHGGVVVAVAFATHAGDDAGRRQALPVGRAGVLDAAIGMMQQSVRWPALGQGHVQCRQRQRGGQRVVHRPADAAARATVQHARHIQPAFVRGHIGDVRHPDGVGLERGHALRQPVGGHGQVVLAVRQAHGLEPPPGPVRQTHLPHQTADAPPTAMMTPLAQPAHHARAAVFLPAFAMRAQDQRLQLDVGLIPRRWLAAGPGVIAAARNVKRLAQLAEGVIGVHGFYRLETLPSAERMPSVFFNMSRWRLTCCSSRLSRRFSSSSCKVERWPGPLAGKAASCFFHCFKLWVLMPRSRAICSTDLPPWSHSSTAFRLKASSYRLYLRRSWFSGFMVFGSSSHNHPTLVHQIEARPLDANGPDGRATIDTLQTGTLISNGDQAYWTTFHGGHQRINLTERLTKNLLSQFQSYVRANSCTECRKAFLGGN